MTGGGRIVVTLDGPAGVGKSTIARMVADELGVAFLDTGAMFRATALALGAGARDLPEAELRACLAGLHFALHSTGADSHLTLNGRMLGDEIRTEEAGMLASNIATLPAVREFLKEAQRDAGRGTSLVAEGRDMGSVVFADATHKFFLDADPRERARRRFLQLREMGREADLADLEESIRRRDEQDRTRVEAPLRPADDAVILDTTRLSLEEVFQAVVRRVKGLE